MEKIKKKFNLKKLDKIQIIFSIIFGIIFILVNYFLFDNIDIISQIIIFVIDIAIIYNFYMLVKEI
jgi:hypothetical protein